MIDPNFLHLLFSTVSIDRWNDQIRPVDTDLSFQRKLILAVIDPKVFVISHIHRNRLH